MTTDVYKPVRQKYSEWAVHYSPVTDQLIKRKRILLFTVSTPQEWLQLAKEFAMDGGRANVAFCMTEYKRRGGDVSFETDSIVPMDDEEFDIPEPDLPPLPDEIFPWQNQTGMSD